VDDEHGHSSDEEGGRARPRAWSSNKPERRSTITVFDGIAAQELEEPTRGAAASQPGNEVTFTREWGATGSQAIVRKRLSMSAVGL
jgi:hypothetical protein